jgi:DNA polymerase-3 subunit delta'
VNCWDVWGQDHLVRELQADFPSAVRHAYIVSGPDMSGKSLVALSLAKALLCLAPPQPGEFCGHCHSCRAIERGIHPDVSLFDLARQAELGSAGKTQQTLSIDTVREVSRNVALRPVEGQWRVVIVDDVETMQETAQEAFLKTLEEPPAFTILLLLTTDATTLLPTILSRCVVLRMQTAESSDIAERLIDSGIEPDVATETARLAQGLPGWAIRAVRDPAMRESRAADVQETMAWIRADRYQRMILAIAQADAFSSDKNRVFARLHFLLLGWRSELLHHLDVPDARSLFIADRENGSGSASLAGYSRALKSIAQCIFDLESNVRPRLALQSMVAQWPEMS